ncbi:MAG: HlyD family efflux transporter periplasmic adaptor subunit [Kofleriaceae bacterium]
MNRKVGLLGIPVIVGIGWAALGAKHDAVASGAVDVSRPTTIVAPGRVEPFRDPVQLAFETGGRIVAIEVDEGDVVKAGQVVARLDDRMAKARVSGAEAALAQAKARYDLARRGPRREDLDAAKADAAAATAEADHRSLEQARSEKLGAAGAIASASVDTDLAAARVSTATAAAASARYASLARGTRAEQIAEAAASVEAATADLEAAKVALDQTLLKAPADGVVLRRLVEVGTLVGTLTPLPVVSVADLGKLEIRAEIDEADVAAIQMGKTAFATADAFGDKQFPIHVTRITRELGRKQVRDDDPRAKVDTRVLEVVASFDAPPSVALPLGLRMYVHVDRR